jgi:hypothetical protein
MQENGSMPIETRYCRRCGRMTRHLVGGRFPEPRSLIWLWFWPVEVLIDVVVYRDQCLECGRKRTDG